MIRTTHVGSLPRPDAMIARQLKKEEISDADLAHYVHELLGRQLALGLSSINNGELPRIDYVSSTVGRIAGFGRHGTAPLPKDLEELPDYARRFSGRNGLITLNPRAPVQLPACSEKLSYKGETSLRQELDMMVGRFDELTGRQPDAGADVTLFFTAPSPGTVALFLENRYYNDYRSYMEALGEVLRREYEIIAAYDVLVQIDCPDLAMGRHTRYKHMSDNQFLELIELNIAVLNQALSTIPAERCRAHICWGNYPGTHHCDIELDTIFDRLMQLKPMYLSLESCNHRHAHEHRVFRDKVFPDDKVLLPGVIDTTSNTVEHPGVVADRLRNFVSLLGPERVMASTDCGFASTGSAASVSGEIAWLKLRSMVEGARLLDRELGL